MEACYGICHLSVAPVRATASDKSEITSQLLFGELVQVLRTKGLWAEIRCLWDDYTGWIDNRQIKAVEIGEMLEI